MYKYAAGHRYLIAIAFIAAVVLSPFAAGNEAAATTLRCTPAHQYVPLEYVPYSLRAANAGCIYRQPWRGNGPSAVWAWRGAGQKHCLNTWAKTAEWRMMSWQQKQSVMPANCYNQAGHWLFFG